MANFFDQEDTTEEQALVPLPTKGTGNFFDQEDTTEEQAEVKSGEWLDTDTYSTAMSVLQGFTLGWSDEAIVGMGAAFTSAITDVPYGQAYSLGKQEYDSVARDFANRHPEIALGAEITGSILSPVAKIGMGVKGATGAVGLATRGAAEGAIYGAGSAKDLDSVMTESGVGAVTGGAFGGIIGTGGWLLKKRVSQDLEVNGEFTPITLAAREDKGEGLIKKLYRDVIGPSAGGSAVRQQEEIVVKPVIEKQKERITDLKKYKNASEVENKRAADTLRVSINKLNEGKALKNIEEKARDDMAVAMVRGSYDKFLGPTGAVIAKQAQQINKSIEENQDVFRLIAFDSALPAGAKKTDVRRIVEAGNTNVAMLRLDKLWQKEGFKSLKDRKFRMKPEEMYVDILKRLDSDDSLKLLGVSKPEIDKKVQIGLNILLDKRTKSGWIEGESISAVRNSFGTAASKLSDEGEGAIMQAVYREIQGVIDGNIKKQLSPKGLTAFEGDLSSWATQTVLRDAVTSASKKAGREGRFTPDEWLQASARNSKKQARQYEGPLRKEAEDISKTINRQEKTIIDSSLKLTSSLASRREKEVQRLVNKQTVKKAKADAAFKRLTTKMSDKGGAEAVAQKQTEIQKLTAEIEDGKAVIEEIRKNRTLAGPSWFHSLAATGFMGGVVPEIANSSAKAQMAGQLITAIGLSERLASPTGQKAIAGQTKAQTVLREGLQKQINTPAFLNNLSGLAAVQSFPRTGAGLMTGE